MVTLTSQPQDRPACSSVSVRPRSKLYLAQPADDCRLVTDADVRRLRSADTRTLVVDLLALEPVLESNQLA